MFSITNRIKIRISYGKRNPLDDEFIELYNLKSTYVSDGIGDDYKYWNSYNPVFISTQTGMGKNTFIEDVLLKTVIEERWKILIVSNRVAVNRQQKKRIAQLVGCEQELEFLTDKGLDNLEDFCNVKIISYQKLGFYVNNVLNSNKLGHFNYVIYDEVHYFISDSLFNNTTGRTLNNSLMQFKSSIRIYLTATPDEILPVLIEEEKCLYSKSLESLYSLNYLVKPKRMLFYNFKRCYDYINTKYLSTKNELIELLKNDKSPNKWLIFVNSMDDGNYFINQLGSNAVFITAESKNSSDIDGTLYKEIVNSSKFTCKILVTTSVLDNGVNFKDDLLKNIVIFSHDKTEFVQMLGRKRVSNNEKINLYIYARDIHYFVNVLRTINNKIQAIYCYKESPSKFIDEYFLKGDINKYKLAAPLFYKDRSMNLCLNNLAEKKLYYDKVFIEKILSDLKSGHKEAFIIEQLSWISLQKTYLPESWVSFSNHNDQMSQFLKFLDDNCNIELSPSEFKCFGEKFKCFVTIIMGKQNGDRSDRNSYGETKIRKIFRKYDLKYDLEIKQQTYTLRKSFQ